MNSASSTLQFLLQSEGMPGPEEGDEVEEAADGWSTEGHHHQEHLSGTLSCSSNPSSKNIFPKIRNKFPNNQAEMYVQEMAPPNFLEV